MKYENCAVMENVDSGETVFVAIEGPFFGYKFGVNRKDIAKGNQPTICCTEPLQQFLDIYDGPKTVHATTFIAMVLLNKRARGTA